MVEVRNNEKELSRFRLRIFLAIGFIFLCFTGLIARFAYLQVFRFDEFHAQAEDNRIAVVPVPPPRGLIFDRNGVLMAENVSGFTVEIKPEQVKNVEETINEIASIIEIRDKDRKRFKRFLEEAKNYDSIPLKVKLTDDEVAKLTIQRFRLPGVEIKARLFRNYPLGETASHVLGYIGRISVEDKAKLEANDQESEYAGSTHIGKVGVELSYEKKLHGQTGFDEVEVSAGGRTVRSLSKTVPVAGNNLVLSIDVKLQKLVEQWFGDRKGALVAIEPETGDVLAFVSKPTFDPNLFVDGIDSQLWQTLTEDPEKPLLNRPLRGTYPPGSTYKPFMALAALESGTRGPFDTISDPGYFQLGGHRFRDSKPGGNGTVNLHKSIVVSSDTYYYKVAYEMGVDKVAEFMKPWGFGQLTGIDIDNETAGILPSTAWKMKRYKQKWIPGETPSIGIGQGANTFTILQLANATAVLANNGVYMRPHVVKSIEDPLTRKKTLTVPSESYRINVKPEHFEWVRAAMVDVNKFGTSRIAFANAEYTSAGKTGTAQVINIKQGERYDAKKIAERFRDHSLFMSFAPADKPKIALAVIVENGGFGAQAAAPIARKVFDYYLTGKLPKDGSSDATLESFGKKPEDLDFFRDVPERPEGDPVSPAEASRQ
jgi:penicillin-binding protein 2